MRLTPFLYFLFAPLRYYYSFFFFRYSNTRLDESDLCLFWLFVLSYRRFFRSFLRYNRNTVAFFTVQYEYGNLATN